MNLVEELRNKVSRDNRELLDRAADRIEELYRTLLTAYEKIEEMERDRAGDGALEVCEYIKRSDVEALIKDFRKGLIEKKRDYVEVTEFNVDIQKKLKGLPGVEMPIYTHFMGKPISEVVELIKANDEGRFIAVPCKVGDIAYCIISKGGLSGGLIFTGHIIKRRVDKVIFDGSRWEMMSEGVYPDYKDGNGLIYAYFDDLAFVDEGKAKARLEEILDVGRRHDPDEQN